MKNVILMRDKDIKKMIVVGTLSTMVFFIILVSPLLVEGVGANHWAHMYLEELSENHGVETVFNEKELNQVITVEDFQSVVKLVLDEKYSGRPDAISRKAVVHELTKIWAEKAGQDLDKIPVIRMLIYTDTEEIEARYNHSITVANMKNIAKGKGKGIFAPKDEVTYGELAALVYNTEIAI